MYKKLLIAGASSALLLATVVPAFAGNDEGGVRVENDAHVRNTALAVSNTGLNRISGHEVEGGRIRTGASYSDGYINNVVNTTTVGGE